MTDLTWMLTARPFAPFAVHMSNGERIEIRHPEMAMLSRSSLAVGVPRPDGSPPPLVHVVEHLSLLHMVKLEPLAVSEPAAQA